MDKIYVQIYRLGLLSLLLGVVAPVFLSAQTNDKYAGFARFNRKTAEKGLDEELQKALDNNDSLALRRYLEQDIRYVNKSSRSYIDEETRKVYVPLLHDAIERYLNNRLSLGIVTLIFDFQPDIDVLLNARPAIYSVLDAVVRSPRSVGKKALPVFDLFMSHKDFDPNKRYGSLPPALPYVLRQSYIDKTFIAGEDTPYLVGRLLKRGASIASYTEKGGDLLDFAIDSQNDELKKFLIDKGINLNYRAEGQKTSVERAIEQGDAELFNLALKNGAKLNIQELKIDFELLKEKPQIHKLLAKALALTSTSYEDFSLFAKYFTDYKDLIKDKYTSLAETELASATDYRQIKEWVKRYPDLNSLFKLYALKQYQRDIAKLKAQKNKCIVLLERWIKDQETPYPISWKMQWISVEIPSWDEGNISSYFLKEYVEEGKFDPENYAPEAYAIEDMSLVCRALRETAPLSFVQSARVFGVSLAKASFNLNEAERCRYNLERGLKSCRDLKKNKDYAAIVYYLEPILIAKQKDLERQFKVDYEAYLEENKDYESLAKLNKEDKKRKQAERLQGCRIDHSRTKKPMNGNDGEVHLYNGEILYWFWKGDGRKVVLRTRWFDFDKTYETFEDMCHDIIKQCNEN